MDSHPLKKLLKTSLLCLFLINSSSFAATKITLDNEQLPSDFKPGFNNLYSLKSVNEIVLPNGKVKYKYKQYYKNIPVWGEHLTKEKNTEFTGSLLKNIEQDMTVTTPQLSQAQVFELIKKKFGDFNQEDSNLNIELFIKNINDVAKLIYKVDFLLEKPKLSRPSLILDANTGEVLEQWDGLTKVEMTEATGPGGNKKTGRYEYGKEYGPLIATKMASGKCRMKSTNVITYDKKHSDSMSAAKRAVPYTFDCPENTYKEINDGFSPINDAHYFGNVVFQMYKDWFNTKPLKTALKLFVHYGEKHENAYWVGNVMLFGDGDEEFYPLVSLDVIAHEVSHGFTEQNSGLAYKGQSGGINESFSDIAGEAAKYYMNKDKPENQRNDWMVGQSIMKGGADKALRYFKDPKKDGESIDNAKDFDRWMDPHYSSGVFNKAFYNLATSKGWDVPGAFKTFVTANRVYWDENSTYDQAACGIFKAAKDLDQNTDDVIAAFKDVGVKAECKKDKDKKKKKKKGQYDENSDDLANGETEEV